MPKEDYQSAIEELAQYLNLTPEALDIAEGWSILPEGAKRHVKILIDDHIATAIPLLKPLYERTSHRAQKRFNDIAERIQGEKHKRDS